MHRSGRGEARGASGPAGADGPGPATLAPGTVGDGAGERQADAAERKAPGPVLVLNASMEPLAVIDARRAIVLAFSGKAEVVHENGACFRSPTITVQAPTVLRLHRQVKVPRRGRAGLSRRAVFLRDSHRCQYCGRAAEDVDHVVPRSRGGPHVWENVVASCRRCNGRKQDRTPKEAGFRLASPPRVPPPAFWLLVRAGKVSDDWRPYLVPYLGDRWAATLDLLPVA